MARDIGLILDTSCELTELHRDQTGSFNQTNACSMQQLTDAVFLWKEHDDDRALRRLIAPVESILGHFPRIIVKDGAAAAISHGAALARPGIVGIDDEIERGDIVFENNVFVGSHCFIGGKVHIGHHSAIAAGTILIGNDINIPPYSLIVGNPYKIKKGYYDKSQ